jgi:hypothetical protein
MVMLSIPPKKPRRSRIEVYRLLGAFALVHAACVLGFFRLIWYGHDTPDWASTAWVYFAAVWLFWPVVLALHPGRSWLRFPLFVIGGLLIILPSIPEGRWWAENVLRLAPEFEMPTLDKPLVERTVDLGSGFRRVMLAEFIMGGFESVYHAEYLFYRDWKLGDFDSSSISPSRKYAAFIWYDYENPQAEGRYSFHVYLFGVDGQTSTRLTDKPLFDVGRLDWDANGDLLLWRQSTETPMRFPVSRLSESFSSSEQTFPHPTETPSPVR